MKTRMKTLRKLVFICLIFIGLLGCATPNVKYPPGRIGQICSTYDQFNGWATLFFIGAQSQVAMFGPYAVEAQGFVLGGQMALDLTGKACTAYAAGKVTGADVAGAFDSIMANIEKIKSLGNQAGIK